MRRLPTALYALAAITPFAAPAFAHHSIAMFDQSKEILIEGTVARFDWVNPHMYLVVETKGPDGKPALVEAKVSALLRRSSTASIATRSSPAHRSSCARIPIAAAGASRSAFSTSRPRT